MPSRSGRGALARSSSPALGSSVGAAFTTFAAEAPPPFLRLSAAGTNAVLSFLKSRSSGSAETIASFEIGALGLLGKEGGGGGRVDGVGVGPDGREARWAWKV